jgi:hypothetical protein
LHILTFIGKTSRKVWIRGSIGYVILVLGRESGRIAYSWGRLGGVVIRRATLVLMPTGGRRACFSSTRGEE